MTTINFRTGEIRESRREDYITKVSGCPIGEPGAPCPMWSVFLKKVMGEDESLIDYLQRVCGYCLTGLISEQVLFFLYGTGANGKGVFINTIRGIMGSYHTTAPIDTFTVTNSPSHPTDLAGLRGARLVTAIETEEGRRWSEAKIKALTGGDEITARFMRQDFFSFTPTFKLMIVGNHKPRIRTVDEAMRRRIQMIPFNITIPKEDRDPDLTEKLKAEWPAILRWMIDGTFIWKKDGLRPPDAVIAATNQYLEAEDTVAVWVAEKCDLVNNKRTASALLFASFREWAEKNGEFVGTQRALIDKLLQRPGIERSPDSHMRGLQGISLRPEEEAKPAPDEDDRWRGYS
jgi:putative DNA primase/helicase